MKTHVSKLFSPFALAVLVLTASCSDDEQSVQAGSDLTVNGTEYTIAKAYITTSSQTKMGADLDGDGKGDPIESKTAILSFTTGELEVGEAADGDEDFVGVGNLLLIILPETMTTDNVHYPVGTYSSSQQVQAYFISFDDIERWNVLGEHSPGTLTLTKSGSVYTLEGELVDEDSGLVNCTISFRGQLTDFQGLRL